MKYLWLTLCTCMLSTIVVAQNEKHTIYFNKNSSSLATVNYSALNSFIKQIDSIAIDSIAINGYSDYLGNRDYNQRLSEKRAKNVFLYLKTVTISDISEENVHAIGEIHSIFNTPNGVPEDRKVDIILYIAPKKYSIYDVKKITYFKAEVGMSFDKSYTLGRVFFVNNKADILEASLPQLNDLYNQIKQLKSKFTLKISGHICCLSENATQDDKDFSRVLSTARALRIKEYLVDKKIPEKYIDIKGYSFDEPLIFPELNNIDKQTNRRIEVVVSN